MFSILQSISSQIKSISIKLRALRSRHFRTIHQANIDSSSHSHNKQSMNSVIYQSHDHTLMQTQYTLKNGSWTCPVPNNAMALPFSIPYCFSSIDLLHEHLWLVHCFNRHCSTCAVFRIDEIIPAVTRAGLPQRIFCPTRRIHSREGS